jgi:hypothetical protein
MAEAHPDPELAELVDQAVAKMCDESGLPERTVRPMIEMEAQRMPASLTWLAGRSPRV